MTLLLERRELAEEQVRSLLAGMMTGQLGDAETAALLVGLRMKGETSGELAAAVGVLREHMVRLETGRTDLLDTCGTGGDGSGTFNISTAAALVTAGAGVPVVKHGNRAVSSRSGSADVLAALGVPVEAGVAWAQRCLEHAGLAFCFAPHFHPALASLGPLRRRLGVRTIFNLLGPLLNPAGAQFQVLGVGRPELLDPLAGALARLGTKRAFVVWSEDGLDEVSLAAATHVREVRSGGIEGHKWHASDFRLSPCSLHELQAVTPAASAAMVGEVLEGKESSARRVVLANAAAGLLAAGRVDTLHEGVSAAQKSIDSGKALQVLERLKACR